MSTFNESKSDRLNATQSFSKDGKRGLLNLPVYTSIEINNITPPAGEFPMVYVTGVDAPAIWNGFSWLTMQTGG